MKRTLLAVCGCTFLFTFTLVRCAPTVSDEMGTLEVVAADAPGFPPPVVEAVSAATATQLAVRGDTVQVADTIPAPTTTTIPTPTPGDCESWRAVFRYHGASTETVAFFVDGGIISRESGCGLDTLNDDTDDSGVCQINPIHNRAGYFGGVEFGQGGWLMALHGLRTGIATDDPRWAAACITLHEVCGSGPWRPPYSCANNRIDL